VPYIFLANGDEIRFWEWQREAFPRVVKTFFKQDDLERRSATRQLKRDPMTVEIDRRIIDRDYQRECIDTLCREMNNGRRKLLVEMATGTGKTRTAAALIKRLFEAHAITRVLFLVDRIPLAKQTEDAFAEHLPDYPSYVLRAGRRFQDEKRITITTLQSMINVYGEYSAGYFDLVISDECHRSIYGQWSGVLKHFDGIQIGLTATPCVTDGGFDEEEDKLFVRDTLRFFEVEKPTYSYKLKDAIRDGHLVPYQIYKAKTVKTAAEGGFEVKRSELDWSAMDSATREELEKLFAGQQSIIVDPSSLERRFTIPERNRAIVREFRDVLDNGYTDHKGVLRKPLFGKTIVFAVTKREKFPQILVSVNMLDTGFDCPEVVSLVFARFTRSAILYQQMRGRGTRKARGKPAFTMFDFVGVCDFHGDDEEFGTGGVVIAKAARKIYPPRRLLALDIDDRIDPTTREWITVDENGNMVFREASEIKATELGTRFEAWLLAQAGLAPEQEHWLRMVGSQIRANAGTMDEFTVGHFAFHPFSQLGGQPQAVRIFGSAARLDGLMESLNSAVFGADPGDATPREGPRPSVH